MSFGHFPDRNRVKLKMINELIATIFANGVLRDMNFHSSVVIYIRLIKEISMVVQKIIQSTFPVFAMKPILEVQNLE